MRVTNLTSLKNFNKYILTIVVFICSVSCSKNNEEVKAIIPPTANPVLTVDESFVVLSNLGEVAYALEAYKIKYRQYPISSDYQAGWDTLFVLDEENRSNWIEGLVPEFLNEWPRVAQRGEIANEQYKYKSNGAQYKLIATSSGDIEDISKRFPSVIDPARPGLAYGYWTVNAGEW